MDRDESGVIVERRVASSAAAPGDSVDVWLRVCGACEGTIRVDEHRDAHPGWTSSRRRAAPSAVSPPSGVSIASQRIFVLQRHRPCMPSVSTPNAEWSAGRLAGEARRDCAPRVTTAVRPQQPTTERTTKNKNNHVDRSNEQSNRNKGDAEGNERGDEQGERNSGTKQKTKKTAAQ